MNLRPITTGDYAAIETPHSFGRPQQLKWLPIASLVVDPEYQRDITLQGRTNVRRIAQAFNWSMFAPIVVASIGGDKYAIVDGQHRTTAAKLCGLDKVPCAIIEATRGEQASAFKAINGNVTRLSSIQLFHASVAAGDAAAVRVARVCKAADVVILRYPKAWDIIAPGETLTPVIIGRAIVKFGEEIATLALRTIRHAGGGQAGALRGPIIFGTAEVLHDHTEWRDADRLAQLFDTLDLFAMLNESVAAAAHTRGSSTIDQFEARLVAAIAAHHKRAPVQARKTAAAKPPAKPAPVEPQKPTGPIIQVEKHGIVVHGGKEPRVEHAGAAVRLQTNEARLLAALLPGSPAPIVRSHIVKKIWGTKVPEDAIDIVSDLARGIDPRLRSIGLLIKHVPGVGLALQKAGIQ